MHDTYLYTIKRNYAALTSAKSHYTPEMHA